MNNNLQDDDNLIDGIETLSCCCGHSKKPCYIWFKARNIEIINRLMFHCFNHEWFWKIELDPGDPNRHWTDLHLVLYSDGICSQKDFDDLTYRINNKFENIKITKNEWTLFKIRK